MVRRQHGQARAAALTLQPSVRYHRGYRAIRAGGDDGDEYSAMRAISERGQ